MELTPYNINSLAPNADAMKNGRALTGKLDKLQRTDDHTLIFGQCAGSGKQPYQCSVDQLNTDKPIFRCSCPSRQTPCKHVLALMYAYAEGRSFDVMPVPEEIALKREKLLQQAKNKAAKEEQKAQGETSASPDNRNTTRSHSAAKKKKILTQLTGVEQAGKLLHTIVQTGLSAIDIQAEKGLKIQIKELGNYYISGIQNAFTDLLEMLHNVHNAQYTQPILQLGYLHALLQKSHSYLTDKLNHPDVAEVTSPIEEQIGYAWKLDELYRYNRWQPDAELLQLAFYSYDNPNRREWVDEGYWIELHTGRLFKTRNYRPYRAAEHIKAEDSFPYILQTERLYIYPGDINPRIRWESGKERDVTIADINAIKQYAHTDYAELVKQIKNTIKNPLNDKHPIALVTLHKAFKSDYAVFVEDNEGHLLTLSDISYFGDDVLIPLETWFPSQLDGTVMAVMFDCDLYTGILTARPLAWITNRVITFLY
ncbi:MAG: SWIM zinc finger family protein [Mediterranea sp.]|jgi:hypothetical protein|nr:SWIM zinc finger family protein [Mediterranea sp.]